MIKGALAHVPSLGWSDEALVAGAQEAGLPPVAHGLLQGGVGDLVHECLRSMNEELSKALRASRADSSARRDGEIDLDAVRAGARMRTELLLPHATHWSEAMAVGAQPQNAATTLELVAHAVDEIWWHAGDRETSPRWYVRRAALGKALFATELCMITDEVGLAGGDFDVTLGFLDRQLDVVLPAGEGVADASSVVRAAADGVFALLTAVPAVMSPRAPARAAPAGEPATADGAQAPREAPREAP